MSEEQFRKWYGTTEGMKLLVAFRRDDIGETDFATQIWQACSSQYEAKLLEANEREAYESSLASSRLLSLANKEAEIERLGLLDVKTLDDINEELCNEIDAKNKEIAMLREFIVAFSHWDMLDVTSDGTYWKKQCARIMST
jgi:hypothetical protein